MTKALIFQRVAINHERSDYTNFTLVKNTVDFEYKIRSKIVLWQTSKTLFHNSADEYDTTLLNSILEIPKLDNRRSPI
jgi:hypothetical protein